MRASAAALLFAGLVIGLSASGALAFAVASRSRVGVVLGEAVLLISLGVLRVFFAVSIGPLRRRRAFEPDRVREAPAAGTRWPYLLALAGAALLVASLIRGWLDFLDGYKHPTPSIGAYLIWIVVAVVGFGAVAIAYTRNKDGALRASALPEAWIGSRLAVAWSAVDRFLAAPATELARRTGDGLAAGDERLARGVAAAGRLAAAVATRPPAVPLVILLAVILAIGLGLTAPGVFR
jgi:hypothetical protein